MHAFVKNEEIMGLYENIGKLESKYGSKPKPSLVPTFTHFPESINLKYEGLRRDVDVGYACPVSTSQNRKAGRNVTV